MAWYGRWRMNLGKNRGTMRSICGVQPSNATRMPVKQTKKKRREIDRKKRGAWGAVSPVMRYPGQSDAYDRKKTAAGRLMLDIMERNSGGVFLSPKLSRGAVGKHSGHRGFVRFHQFKDVPLSWNKKTS